ncbi:hypothetical protein A3SI_19351 [Nitritalea halalkaliphila LW7]|uniref:Uncharacterized protein n=1 Tax=Nitritalea halalkaliphila LW7 TaxID=1189621 RepID=I5BTA2_9BACT|nr:hypothetical protein [Nitritalea halalkaliphila]EIM72804.1 hypothetical protein A3SI_19351 [Nitritalea halalkaliphila LW7]
MKISCFALLAFGFLLLFGLPAKGYAVSGPSDPGTSTVSKRPAGEGKRFMILLNEELLKAYKSSPTYVELSLTNLFKTKAYKGNSAPVIFVDIPHSSVTAEQLQHFIIRVNARTVLPLQDIAEAIIDLSENSQQFEAIRRQVLAPGAGKGK